MKKTFLKPPTQKSKVTLSRKSIGHLFFLGYSKGDFMVTKRTAYANF